MAHLVDFPGFIQYQTTQRQRDRSSTGINIHQHHEPYHGAAVLLMTTDAEAGELFLIRP